MATKNNRCVVFRKESPYTFHERDELRRWLKKQGCTFETHRGGSGHVTVRRGDRTTQLPMHGGKRELGRGLVDSIKKDLGLK